MNRVLLILGMLVEVTLLAGCISDGSGSGGIDPVTMQGIEDSNRATQEAAQRQAQEAIDQANANTVQQANEQAAAQAAAAAAQAAAAANQ